MLKKKVIKRIKTQGMSVPMDQTLDSQQLYLKHKMQQR
jgi:hypothetical protein